MTKQASKKDRLYQLCSKAISTLKTQDLTSWLCFSYGALVETNAIPEHTVIILQNELEERIKNKIGGE